MSKPTNTGSGFADLLKTRFLAITTTDYNYSYTNIVYVNEGSPVEEGINIQKGNVEELFKDTSDTYSYCKAPITIDVITKNDSKDADLVVADLLKSIGTNPTFTGTAINTNYLNTQSDVPDQQGNKIADRRIYIEVFFRKTIWSA